MTKRGITVVLAIACVLCVIGAALAASVWIIGATNSQTITVGEAIQMAITDDNITGNDGLCPGESATITLKADNKSQNAVLKVELTSQWAEYFDISVDVGTGSNPYQTAGVTIEANGSPVDVTITITLKANASTDISNQVVTVNITLDKAA